MTDDEMQALREVEGCGLEEMDGTPDFDALRHDRAAQWLSGCDACAKLYNDAVVRQRVERMSEAEIDKLTDAMGFTWRRKARRDLLAALTGENA